MMLSITSCAYLPFVCPFGKVSVQITCLLFKIGLFFFLLCFENYLYILDVNLFFSVHFANIFVPLCDLLFHSFSSVFLRTEILYFDEVQFIRVFFSFMDFGVVAQKSFHNISKVTKIFLLCFHGFRFLYLGL